MNTQVTNFIEWDVVNWSKAIPFWSENTDLESNQNNCLELGARNGGLSLWLAIKGNKVICSDIVSPKENASKLHLKHLQHDKIQYQAIDATNIPYEACFDIIVFKSILGGISSENANLKQETIDEIYKALKPSGKLLFAENLEASSIHRFFRKKFIKWGNRWNYLKYDEISPLFKSFENVKFQTVGFLGAFGRTELQRRILGKIDSMIRFLIPKKKRYIVLGVASKADLNN